MVLLANDRELMGRHVNGRVSNVLAWLIVAFVSIYLLRGAEFKPNKG